MRLLQGKVNVSSFGTKISFPNIVGRDFYSEICFMEWLQIILTLVGSIGGWEAVKWFLNRKNNIRMAENQADESEFSVLAKTNVFLQEQLAKKEERFAEQTDRIRLLTSENITLTSKVARLEAERRMKLCDVRACPNREPQSGY